LKLSQGDEKKKEKKEKRKMEKKNPNKIIFIYLKF
jgi:hypothetical protein